MAAYSPAGTCCRLVCLSTISAASLALLASLAWPQQSESPAQQQARIDRLIQQLDDDKFDVREKAEAELATIGEAALPKLLLALKDTSAERKERAEKLVRRMRELGSGLDFRLAVQRDDLANANSASVSPDGRFVYLSAFAAHSATVFRFEPATASLEHVETKADPQDLLGAMAFRLSKDGKLAVATCGSGRSVVLFSRDADKGTLTQLDIVRSDQAGPRQLSAQSDAAFTPDGRHLYTLDRSGAIVVFEVADGKQLKHVETFTSEEECFKTACGMAMHPDGTELLVAAADAAALSVLKCDAKTGKLTLHQVLRDEQDGIHGFARVYGVVYSPDCRFAYTCSDVDNAITALKFDENRKLTVMQEFLNDQSELKDFVRGNEIIVTPDGLSLYASGSASNSLACFDVDPKSGKLSYRATIRNEGTTAPTGDGATGLAVTPDGDYIFVTLSSANAVSVFKRSPPTRP